MSNRGHKIYLNKNIVGAILTAYRLRTQGAITDTLLKDKLGAFIKDELSKYTHELSGNERDVAVKTHSHYLKLGFPSARTIKKALNMGSPKEYGIFCARDDDPFFLNLLLFFAHRKSWGQFLIDEDLDENDFKKQSEKNNPRGNVSRTKRLSNSNRGQATSIEGNWCGEGKELDLVEYPDGYSKPRYRTEVNVNIKLQNVEIAGETKERVFVKGVMTSYDHITGETRHKNVRFTAEGERKSKTHVLLTYDVHHKEFDAYGVIIARFYGIGYSDWCIVAFRANEDERAILRLELQRPKKKPNTIKSIDKRG